MSMRLILASGSQRRRELLTMCGYEYEIVVSNADESIFSASPDELVKRLALRKARDVFDRMGDPECVVVGADTVVAFNGQIIGKPKDAQDSFRILSMLSANTHCVYTGVAVVNKMGAEVECEATNVTFSKLSDDEILSYIATGDPFDKAGSYGIQGQFGMFVDRVEGNYFNVIGMPLPALYRMLLKAGIKPAGF